MIRKTNYELMLERRITHLENTIKNEAVRGVPANEIPDYIIKAFTKRLKEYMDKNIFNREDEFNSLADYVKDLERRKDKLMFYMGTAMSSTLYREKIIDGPDDKVGKKLFNDLAKNVKPKTAFLKNLYEQYMQLFDERINSAKAKLPAPYALESEVEQWFNDNMGPEMYNSDEDWQDDLKWMSKRRPNGSAIEDCMEAIGARKNDYAIIRKQLATLAKEALDQIESNRPYGKDAVGVWTDPWA